MKNAANDQMTLEFTWTMDIGEDGVDDDPINPISRSLNDERDLKNGGQFKAGSWTELSL